MSLKAAELEQTLEIEIDILTTTYPRDPGAVHFSADIWNNIRALVV